MQKPSKWLIMLAFVGIITIIWNFIPSGRPANADIGTGLKADYFIGQNFSTLQLTRVDPTVSFNWGTGSPDPKIPSDHFSARWTGLVVSKFSETYNFSTISDDGVRLWVNGQLIIDNWNDHPPTENYGSIELTAGVKYNIKMEFFENAGGARAELYWTSAHQEKEIIPASQLYPNFNVSSPVVAASVTAGSTTDGNWYDCNGALDNDISHHTSDPNDLDVAHHLGMLCDGQNEAWQPTTTSTGTTAQAMIIMPPPVMTSATAPTTNTTSNSNSSIFAGAKLYVNPYSDPKKWADAHRSYDPANASLMDKIANQAETEWFGSWNSDLTRDVSSTINNIKAQGALPVFVAYNIPERDCSGGYSAGGGTPDSYRAWIKTLANAIGSNKAAVILEPDALADLDCLSTTDQNTRMQLLSYAVGTLKAQGHVAVYLDAGHPGWQSAQVMANRLKQAGIGQADGFSLNISNFFTTSENTTYGQQISSMVGNKHFVIDTSRNGLGAAPDGQWCNPPRRALGNPPTTNTGNSLIDALLWVKGPGGSDGACNGAPAAGVFWPEYALGLAKLAKW